MAKDSLQRLTSSKSEHVFYLTKQQSKSILLYLIIMSIIGIVGICLALYFYYRPDSDGTLPSLLLIALFSIPSALLGSSLQYIHMLYQMYFDVQPVSDEDKLTDEAKEWANRGTLVYFYSRPPVITIICFFFCIAISKGLTTALTKEQSISDSGYMTIMVAAFLLSFAGGKMFERLATVGVDINDKMEGYEEETTQDDQEGNASEEDKEGERDDKLQEEASSIPPISQE